MANILIIEDDNDLQELIRYNLSNEGHTMFLARDGFEGVKQAQDIIPQLILLDLMLPGNFDGLKVCQKLRENNITQDIPIIMITAKSEEVDIITGFKYGADDYIAKPFSIKILIARIHSVLRRFSIAVSDKSNQIKVGHIIIDIDKHEVIYGSTTIILSATEFAILVLLAQKPGWVFSREKIINEIKSKEYPVTDRSIDVQIFGLRKKLGKHAHIIETVRSVGYKIRAY